MSEDNKEITVLKEENDKLRETIRRMREEENSKVCAETMDYEHAYYALQHNYQELANENENLKEALVKVALKL